MRILLPKCRIDTAVWAPIHAWRALGCLRDAQAVQPLLDLLVKLDALDDDWYIDEFPDILRLIGPAAIDPAAAYLADPAHRMYPRTTVATGLQRIAKAWPESRPRVLEILNRQLARHEEQDADFNAFLIDDLIELKARESAELIERAFAAGRVDPTINGDWLQVRKLLGVPGLGLVSEIGEAPSSQPSSSHNYEPLSGVSSFGGDYLQDQPGHKKKTKNKKKEQSKSRKRNRKHR